jgi:hypothetical protein
MRNIFVCVIAICFLRPVGASEFRSYDYFFNGGGVPAVLNLKTGNLVIGGHDSMQIQSCRRQSIKLCFEIPFLEIEIALPANLKSTASWRGEKYIHCRRLELKPSAQENIFYVESGIGENCLNFHRKSVFLFSSLRGVTMFGRFDEKIGSTFTLLSSGGLGVR